MHRVGALLASIGLLFCGDRAAESLRANYDRGLVVGEQDDRRSGPEALFPAFREFLGGLRVARINAALHAGDPQRALRYARELAVGSNAAARVLGRLRAGGAGPVA